MAQSAVSCKQHSAGGHSDLVVGKPALSQDSGIGQNHSYQGHSFLARCTEAQESFHEGKTAAAAAEVVLEVTVADTVAPLPMAVHAAKS